MIFATFITALLCGMGVGSGGIFIVYLTMLMGYGQLAAQGLNLYFFIFATSAAMLIHIRTRQLPIKRLFLLCASGMLGCIFGASLAQNLDGGMLKKIFAAVLIITGCISLFSGKKERPLPR